MDLLIVASAMVVPIIFLWRVRVFVEKGTMRRCKCGRRLKSDWSWHRDPIYHTHWGTYHSLTVCQTVPTEET